jgi:excisionase family DNA binding protein
MLTPREAAKRSGISVSLIYQWVESRVLAHYRAGAPGRRGKILIAEADLDAFMATLRVEGRQESVPAAKQAKPKRAAFKHLGI